MATINIGGLAGVIAGGIVVRGEAVDEPAVSKFVMVGAWRLGCMIACECEGDFKSEVSNGEGVPGAGVQVLLKVYCARIKFFFMFSYLQATIKPQTENLPDCAVGFVSSISMSSDFIFSCNCGRTPWKISAGLNDLSNSNFLTSRSLSHF